MKRFVCGVAAAVAVAGVALIGQSGPDLNYDATDPITLPALGEVAGVATNSKGHVFTFVRAGQPYATLGTERTFYHGGARLFEFDQAGKFVREIGQKTYAFDFAENVRVDAQDNIWAVDAGSNMVTHFDAEGKLVSVLGRKPENINVRPGPGQIARNIDPVPPPPAPGAGGGGAEGGGGGRGNQPPGASTPSENFNRPTDIAFDREGNLYLADGVGNNNRIAKFNRDGNWVTGWGQTGSAQGQFNKVTGIVTDSAGNVYVADHDNGRIQVFDGMGTFKSQITGIGKPAAICISSGANQVIYSSNSNDPESLDGGEIYKVGLDGKVLGKFGKAGRLPHEFGMVNALDCRSENDVWVGELGNWRVQKVTVKR